MNRCRYLLLIFACNFLFIDVIYKEAYEREDLIIGIINSALFNVFVLK